MSDRAVLWERLRSAAIVTGEMPTMTDAAPPWYVRAMVGAAGWMAALLVFGSIGVGMSSLLHEASSAIVTGLVLCGAALWMLRTRSEFVVQFALATSLAGQACIGAGLYRLFTGHASAAYLAFAVVETVLVFVIAHPLHRSGSTLAAALALLFALHRWHAEFIFPSIVAAGFALLLLSEARFPRHVRLLHPVAVGLSGALLAYVPSAVLMSPLAFGGLAHSTISPYRWTGAVLMAGVFAFAVRTLLARRGIALGSRRGVMALIAGLILAALAWQIPAVVASIVLVLVAFECGHRALLGLGMMSMAGVIGYYYYSMNATLLEKSYALSLLGAALLIAWHARRPASPAA